MYVQNIFRQTYPRKIFRAFQEIHVIDEIFFHSTSYVYKAKTFLGLFLIGSKTKVAFFLCSLEIKIFLHNDDIQDICCFYVCSIYGYFYVMLILCLSDIHFRRTAAPPFV